MGCFEEEQRRENILWTPYPSAMKIALDLLVDSRIKRPCKTHIVVILRLMELFWRRNMGKEADILFTIIADMPFGGLEEH